MSKARGNTRRSGVAWWEWIPPPVWQDMPWLFVFSAIAGVAAGIPLLGSAVLGRPVAGAQPYLGDLPAGRIAAAGVGLYLLGMTALILMRARVGLFLLMGFWAAGVPLISAVAMLHHQQWHGGFMALDVALGLGLSAWAWTDRAWFDRGPRRCARPMPETDLPLVGIDRAPLVQGMAVFRDLFPERYRGLPPLFYQFITVGAMFGLLGIVFSVTGLRLMAHDSEGPLLAISLVLVPAVSLLGIVHAVAVLRRVRWALCAVYAWFGSIGVAAWVYLPCSSSLVPSVLVIAFLALCAYYFWNRRNWFFDRE